CSLICIVGTVPSPPTARSPSGPGTGRGVLVSQLLVGVLFLQSSQWYGCSPVCVRWCILRVELWAKPLPQSVQQCGRSPVCVRWCSLRVELWAKPLPQSLQLELCAKPLPQSVQLYGSSPVCVRWCLFRCANCAKPLPQAELFAKLLPQSVQQYSRSPVCMHWCWVSAEGLLNFLLQSMQRWGRRSMRSLWLSLPQ
uniref:Uncharacterized protein n=1 Tax=Chelonoidis abingdonii TaxID=106734 RepID=A0A8C0IR49_CHEAB